MNAKINQAGRTSYKSILDSYRLWMMPLWSDLELWTPSSLKLKTCSFSLDFVWCWNVWNFSFVLCLLSPTISPSEPQIKFLITENGKQGRVLAEFQTNFY